MSTKAHRDCYGTIFPATMITSAGGKVFSVSHPPPAGGVGRGRATVRASGEEWDACRQCHEFSHCYAYSMAKLTMEAAILPV